MTHVLAEILKEVDQPSLLEKAELADHLAERLGEEIPPDIERAHLDTVLHRIGEVESGAVKLIAGEEAPARVRQAISQAGCVSSGFPQTMGTAFASSLLS